MTVKIQTENGQIELSNEVIATVVEVGPLQITWCCWYGKPQSKSASNFNEILKKENFTRGVVIRQEDDSVVTVDVYIIVGIIYKNFCDL